MHKTTFTSESVCSGHPDKICDQISDAVVDAVLAKDPMGRVAVESVTANNHIILAGEVSTTATIDFEKIARGEIKRLGYVDKESGFSFESPLDNYIHEQSREIARGVKKKGAGDQGMMFGYACRETASFMPLPIALAHAIAQKIDEVRENNTLSYLRPDGKSQVTVAYENDKPVAVTKVVAAAPHREDVPLEKVKKDLYTLVILPVLKSEGFSIDEKDITINGTGVWHRGGPSSDSGLTGRKIVVDTYGGYARVGGGAFSGKDPTKVDRSGAYAARYLAKNIVASGLADRAEVRLAYAIGVRKPLMQDIETFGTETVSAKALHDYMKKLLDTSVEGIIDGLDLRRPLYKKTAAYGHFGKKGLPWEKIV